MTSVFVDTSALVAAAARRDQNHLQAIETLRRLVGAQRALFTTNYVLAEAYTMARWPGDGLVTPRLSRSRVRCSRDARWSWYG